MNKPELLLPAGNEECLRAAVNNGADAVYLGLDRFSARQSASNFKKDTLFSVIDYCHKRDVKVYVALNTLVKNDELREYFVLIRAAYSCKADAVIIQDPCFVPIIKESFPGLRIHLSTQATATNISSVPEGVDRIILPRELSIEEIKQFSDKFETEMFVHGALCLSYSGQCLFSSIAGGRSGNRGYCAQPCRKMYNKKYLLSTMDLCLLPKLKEIISTGVSSLKVEGRMRSPLYIATVARVYRKAIDTGKYDEKDMSDLKLAFNREFTTGFAFNRSIVDSRMPMNRGLYLGTFKDGKLLLKEDLNVGDGIAIWIADKVTGYRVEEMFKGTEDGSKNITSAIKGEIVTVDTKGAGDGCPVYKTSLKDPIVDLGDPIKPLKSPEIRSTFKLPAIIDVSNNDSVKILAKVYSKKSAVAADKADVIYYDIMKDDCESVRKELKHAKFFVFTPRIMSDSDLKMVAERIEHIKPDGVLVGNRGLLRFLDDMDIHPEIHLDYSLNCFNDINFICYKGVPIISPELSKDDILSLKNKNFITLIHGQITLMTTKEPISAPELVDEENRHFNVRQSHKVFEILNCKELGLFNKVKELQDAGLKYFLIDTNKDVDKYIRVYRNILSGKPFDDSKIKKGFTTGNFSKSV